MDSVPMTATEVCQPRSVSLTQSSSRLNRDARRHLINATDYASVCKMQRVVIHSPDGRGAAARETMIANGVDESLIQVEQSSGGGLGVEMTFAGLAASSEEYAAMFNPVQTASYAPATAPSYQSPPAEPSGQTDMGEPGASAPTEPTVPAGDDSGYTAPRPPPEQQQTPTPGY
jgi:hypothetical protein